VTTDYWLAAKFDSQLAARLFLIMFAIADEHRTQDDERHAAPARSVHALVQDELRGERGHHKTDRRQWPHETHIALAEQVWSRTKKIVSRRRPSQDAFVGEPLTDKL